MENPVGLGVLVREGIAGEGVVGEKFLVGHDLHSIVKEPRKTRAEDNLPTVFKFAK